MAHKKKKPSKKKSTGLKKTPAKNMSWAEESAWHLLNYLKQTKSSGGQIVVMSTYGDVLVRAGKKKDLDWVSLGSLAASVSSTENAFKALVGFSCSPIQMGELGKNLWMVSASGGWIILGMNAPYISKYLSAFMKHLKAMPAQEGAASGSNEALDGMSGASVDAAFTRGVE